MGNVWSYWLHFPHCGAVGADAALGRFGEFDLESVNCCKKQCIVVLGKLGPLCLVKLLVIFVYLLSSAVCIFKCNDNAVVPMPLLRGLVNLIRRESKFSSEV